MKLNEVKNKDVLKGLSQIEEKSVDLIVADPPYNLNKNFGNSTSWNDLEKWRDWCNQWLLESKRVLKDTGSLFIFGIHKYLCFLQVDLYEMGFKYGRKIIWHYENGFSGFQTKPRAEYEPILWMTKSDDYTYHKIRVPYKSKKRLKNKITKNGKTWEPNPEGKHGGDVWNIPTLAGKRFEDEKTEHPTQKPLAVCRKIIKHFSNENDLVLVPFAGSGSECVAAKELGRNFLGFEINEKYKKIADNRLENTKRGSRKNKKNNVEEKQAKLYTD